MSHYNRLLSLLIVGAWGIGFLFAASGCTSTQTPAASGDVEQTASDDDEIDIGYGTQKRGDVTSAVATVSGDEVRTRRPVRDLTDLLEGNVAGVQVNAAPGGGIQVLIRGISTFYGDDRPLYIVDDVPVMPGPDGTIRSVNPFEVVSITVLKDASATAIYGSRGGNGVIVVRTDK